jgi:TolB-like protein/Flp pilus assembly protein TadD
MGQRPRGTGERSGHLAGQAADDRVTSWKEIARHLGSSVRSVQRWERSEGLPVHRHMHAALGTVYAFRSELDGWWASRPDPPQPEAPRRSTGRSIAVLPFANLDRDLQTEILADGLTEELISTLAQIAGLGVVARTSVFTFKNEHADIREIAARLGVDTVLEGSVRRAEGRIRVVVQLVDAASGRQLWSEPFESRRTDVFALQEDIAHAVAGTLRATLEMPPGDMRPSAPPPRPGAYERYLEGRYYWNRRTPAGFLRAVESFERAVADDPRLAPAWAALAECYGNASAVSTLARAEGCEKATKAARTAIDVDPTLAEAHVSLAGLRAVHFFDWKQAESHFRRALELKPQLPSAHMLYAALVLAPAGRLAEAEAHQLLASDLDPLSAVVINATGMLRLMLRQYDRAAEAFQAALRVDAEYPWANRGLGEVLLLQGRYDQAIEPLRRVEMPGLAAGFLGACYARLGREDEARQCLARLEQSASPSVAYQAAVLRLALGDVDGVFPWLDRARADRSAGVMWLPVDPIWDELHHDERFARVVASMGLAVAPERAVPSAV